MNNNLKKKKINLGIYGIVNKTNGKINVGGVYKTTFNKRWKKHKNMLKRNCHHSQHLQNSYNKYGEQNFKYIILEQMSDDSNMEQIQEREQYWMNYYNSYDRLCGYNMSLKAGCVYMWHNFEFQQMQSERMSKQSKEQWQDPKHQKMMSEQLKKLWENPEFREMQFKKLKKNWEDPEYQKKQSEKMSKQAKKQWQDPEYRKMMSENNSKKMKQRWQDPEYCEMQSKKLKQQWQDLEFQQIMSVNSSRKLKQQWQDLEFRKTRCKLTGQQVLEMRERYAKGNITQTQLAKEYGVGITTIQNIIIRKTWKHI